jgi:hypothetical protein
VPVDLAWLAAQKIVPLGTTMGAQRISDRAGEHVLVLVRQVGPSPSNPHSGRIEHIELRATMYGHAGAGWKPEWIIHDLVDCPGLDTAADFFPKAVTFTDLNREGATKLAIRGESTMLYPGQAPFGGERPYDKALLQPDRAAYKEHMDRVWRDVSVFRYR